MTALTQTGPIAAASTISNGKRFTLISLTAIALFIGATAGLAYSQVALIQVSAPKSGTDIGSMSASHKVRCIMPPAWRKDCGA